MTQIQIPQIQKILGREIGDKEYVSLSKDQLRYLINHYEVINDNTPKIPITYGNTLYKLFDNYYLLVDAEFHQSLLIKDLRGDIWSFTKSRLALLNREVKETLKKHNINIEVELYPAENWYSYIYPSTNKIWESNGVTSREFDSFYFYGKHFDVIILRYSNGALWVRVYSPSLLLQTVKEFIYDNYKEK